MSPWVARKRLPGLRGLSVIPPSQDRQAPSSRLTHGLSRSKETPAILPDTTRDAAVGIPVSDVKQRASPLGLHGLGQALDSRWNQAKRAQPKLRPCELTD